MTHQKHPQLVPLKKKCQISKSPSKTKISPRLARLWWETSLPVVLSHPFAHHSSIWNECQPFSSAKCLRFATSIFFHLSTSKDFFVCNTDERNTSYWIIGYPNIPMNWSMFEPSHLYSPDLLPYHPETPSPVDNLRPLVKTSHRGRGGLTQSSLGQRSHPKAHQGRLSCSNPEATKTMGKSHRNGPNMNIAT